MHCSSVNMHRINLRARSLVNIRLGSKQKLEHLLANTSEALCFRSYGPEVANGNQSCGLGRHLVQLNKLTQFRSEKTERHGCGPGLVYKVCIKRRHLSVGPCQVSDAISYDSETQLHPTKRSPVVLYGVNLLDTAQRQRHLYCSRGSEIEPCTLNGVNLSYRAIVRLLRILPCAIADHPRSNSREPVCEVSTFKALEGKLSSATQSRSEKRPHCECDAGNDGRLSRRDLAACSTVHATPCGSISNEGILA